MVGNHQTSILNWLSTWFQDGHMDSVLKEDGDPLIAAHFRPTIGEVAMVQNRTGCQWPTQKNNGKMMFRVPTYTLYVWK